MPDEPEFPDLRVDKELVLEASKHVYDALGEMYRLTLLALIDSDVVIELESPEE